MRRTGRGSPSRTQRTACPPSVAATNLASSEDAAGSGGGTHRSCGPPQCERLRQADDRVAQRTFRLPSSSDGGVQDRLLEDEPVVLHLCSSQSSFQSARVTATAALSRRGVRPFERSADLQRIAGVQQIEGDGGCSRPLVGARVTGRCGGGAYGIRTALQIGRFLGAVYAPVYAVPERCRQRRRRP